MRASFLQENPRKKRKSPCISLDFFGRFGAFQRVTANSNKKIRQPLNSPSWLCSRHRRPACPSFLAWRRLPIRSSRPAGISITQVLFLPSKFAIDIQFGTPIAPIRRSRLGRKSGEIPRSSALHLIKWRASTAKGVLASSLRRRITLNKGPGLRRRRKIARSPCAIRKVVLYPFRWRMPAALRASPGGFRFALKRLTDERAALPYG